MNAYSEDCAGRSSRPSRGAFKVEAAKTFGVGVSSVKRYVATYREGSSLALKKRPGSRLKLDEAARKLWEANLQERPAATLSERREVLRRACCRACGVSVSDSSVSRALGRLRWSRRKDRRERQSVTRF